MSVKRNWPGTIRRIGRRLTHRYDKNILVDTTSVVFMTVVVTGGREEGRLIEVQMTPEEAEQQATKLLHAAKETRERDF